MNYEFQFSHTILTKVFCCISTITTWIETSVIKGSGMSEERRRDTEAVPVQPDLANQEAHYGAS